MVFQVVRAMCRVGRQKRSFCAQAMARRSAEIYSVSDFLDDEMSNVTVNNNMSTSHPEPIKTMLLPEEIEQVVQNLENMNDTKIVGLGDVSVFVRDQRFRQMFGIYVKNQELQTHLDLRNAMLQESNATSSNKKPTSKSIEILLPVLRDFLKEHYADQVVAYQNLVNYANLKNPQKWFATARNKPREVHIHVGPTNSGKTYSALQSLYSAKSGVYLSPLRLLAWEVFTKLEEQFSTTTSNKSARLLTGQEKKGKEDATHVSCTVEMANLNSNYHVAIIDEIQMITCPDRGAAWTRAILGLQANTLHLCGENDTQLLTLLKNLFKSCGDLAFTHTYTRLSPLTVEEQHVESFEYITKGDALICFSRKDVLAMRAKLEELGHKVAVLYGSLPPECRTAQTNLFNDPDSEYNILVASDVIGMGLNLRIRRIVFKNLRKFDGKSVRPLTHREIRQIAGRAGRYGGEYSNEGGFVNSMREDELATLDDVLNNKTNDATTTNNDHASKNNTTNLTSNKKNPNIDKTNDHIQAGLFPEFERIQKFGQELGKEAGDNKTILFSEILTKYADLADVSDNFFLSDVDKKIIISTMIEDLPLTEVELFMFLLSPVDTNSQQVVSALRTFAQHFASFKNVPLPRMYCHYEIETPTTTQELQQLEELHEILDLYRWLNQRLPQAFPDDVHTFLQLFSFTFFFSKNTKIISKFKNKTNNIFSIYYIFSTFKKSFFYILFSPIILIVFCLSFFFS